METSYSDTIYAGWLVLGRLKDVLDYLAFDAGVSIYTSTRVGITGRAIDFTVRGSAHEVRQFRESLARWGKRYQR